MSHPIIMTDEDAKDHDREADRRPVVGPAAHVRRVETYSHRATASANGSTRQTPAPRISEALGMHAYGRRAAKH